MTTELTDLRARLEALAAKWATSYAASGDWDIGYNSGTHQASIELRALLAPVAPGSAPVRTEDEMLHALGCSRCGKNLKACMCGTFTTPAPVAEPPKCEECVSYYVRAVLDADRSDADCASEAGCSNGGTSFDDCERARDGGHCGPEGRLFKRRVTT
jgi:hypothetical protein